LEFHTEFLSKFSLYGNAFAFSQIKGLKSEDE